jgi:hypothetical protein
VPAFDKTLRWPMSSFAPLHCNFLQICLCKPDQRSNKQSSKLYQWDPEDKSLESKL